MADFRKRMNTNPRRGPYHHRAPSRIVWKTIRGMVPHKTTRGARALDRLKVRHSWSGVLAAIFFVHTSFHFGGVVLAFVMFFALVVLRWQAVQDGGISLLLFTPYSINSCNRIRPLSLSFHTFSCLSSASFS